MDDFVPCAALLACAATAPALRAQADAWLAAFRLEPRAWAAALSVLRAPTAPPDARLQAASLLAWKTKHQLAELQPVAAQAELADALMVAAAGPDVLVARFACTALANLAVHCPAWERPLDTLGEGPRLAWTPTALGPVCMCIFDMQRTTGSCCFGHAAVLEAAAHPPSLQARAWPPTACWSC
jgi:hypothetical protein